MKLRIILLTICTALLLQACSFGQTEASNRGTTSIGNGGTISGMVVSDKTVGLQKTLTQSGQQLGITVYLLKGAVAIDSLLSNDGAFVFINIEDGSYSVSAKDLSGKQAQIDGIPISSKNTHPVQLILHLTIQNDPTTMQNDTVWVSPNDSLLLDADIYFGVSDLGTTVTSALAGMNDGRKSCMASGSYDKNSTFRTLIRFALSDTLQASSIVSAQLVLTPREWIQKSTQGPFSLAVHKVLKSWKEGTGTAECGKSPTVKNSAFIDGVTGLERFWSNDGSSKWNQAGLALDDKDASQNAYAISTLAYEQMTPISFDVHELVNQWLATPSSNYGVLIRNLDELSLTYPSYPHFYSGEDATPTVRPILRIVLGHKISVISSVQVNSSSILEPSSSSSLQNPSSSSATTLYSNSLTIQPGPATAQDVFLYFGQNGTESSWSAYNTGRTDCFVTGAYDNNSLLRTLIRFDLASQIPAGATIQNATLRLTPIKWIPKFGGIAFQIEAHQMLRSWKQGTAAPICGGIPTLVNSPTVDGATGLERFYSADGSSKWNVIGVGLDGIDAAIKPAAQATLTNGSIAPTTLDVTTLVQTWATTPASNFGMLIRNTTEETNTFPDYPHFWSGDAADPLVRPALDIEYQ